MGYKIAKDLKVKRLVAKKHYDFIPSPLSQPHFFWIWCGKRKSGKTYAVCSLILDVYEKAFDTIIVVSPTSDTDGTWQSLKKLQKKDKLAFTETYDNETIQRILDTQKRHVKNDPEHNRLLLVLDDVGTDLKRKDLMKSVDHLSSTLRHWNASCFLLVQSLLQLTGVQATNATQWSIYSQIPRALRKIGQDLSYHLSDEEFVQWIEEATKTKYEFAFLDTEKDDDDIFHMSFGETWAKYKDANGIIPRTIRKRAAKSIAPETD